MKNILVTGATGFVGKNLVRYLKNKNVNVIIWDLRKNNLDANILKNCNTVIHLAGKAHDVKNVSQPQEYYEINYELTKNIYDIFLKSEASKFIFISSVKAVADKVETSLDEEAVPNPQTHYGKSKLMAEEYIKSVQVPTGKSFYILRPCMIHGPGNKGNLSLLYKFVKKGIPYPLAGFDNKRSFLSIENLCFVIYEIFNREDISQGTYLVADDDALSTNEVVSTLAYAINKNPKLLKIPSNIITFLAKIGDYLRLPLTTERLKKLTENYVVKNKKIKTALNKELPLTAIEGLKITANSFNI